MILGRCEERKEKNGRGESQGEKASALRENCRGRGRGVARHKQPSFHGGVHLSRQNGMGYTSFLARLGGALAPLMFLLDEVWRSLPEVTYCGVAVCSGAVAFLLPETLNVRLPEGIEDIEKAP